MAYSAKSMRGKTFIGTPLPNRLHDEFSRLCTLAGRSTAKELETAVAVRVTQLQQQERQGVIRGLR